MNETKLFEITTARGVAGKYPDWLRIIHTANRIAPETFGSPAFSGTQDAWVETYPDAKVTLYLETVTIRATTERGSLLIEQAVSALKSQGKLQS
jgi:hypothetical protein